METDIYSVAMLTISLLNNVYKKNLCINPSMHLYNYDALHVSNVKFNLIVNDVGYMSNI